MKEIVFNKKFQNNQKQVFRSGKVNHTAPTKTKLKTFGQAYGKKKQVLIRKPHGLRHLKRVIARTRDLRIISLRNKYLIAC